MLTRVQKLKPDVVNGPTKELKHSNFLPQQSKFFLANQARKTLLFILPAFICTGS